MPEMMGKEAPNWHLTLVLRQLGRLRGRSIGSFPGRVSLGYRATAPHHLVEEASS